MTHRTLRRACTVLVCALSVVASDAAVASAQPARAAHPVRAGRRSGEVPAGDGGSPRALPPLRSAEDQDPAGPQVPTLGSFEDRPGPRPKGWAPDAEGYQDGRSEVQVDQTSPTREVFDNPDGTTTAQLSTSPARFQGCDRQDGGGRRCATGRSDGFAPRSARPPQPPKLR